MRYQGTDTSLMIMKRETWDFAAEFKERHRREFGFTFEKALVVDDIRVRSVAHSNEKVEDSPAAQARMAQGIDSAVSENNSERTPVYFESLGRINTPVFHLKSLLSGTRIRGPAMIIDETQTIVVIPSATASILKTCIVMDLDLEETPDSHENSDEAIESISIDPVRLSIFGHRFMSIAEQMGRTLQKTSVSTNIKERLDFSCALFSPDGGLVANAPHVPVHLGVNAICSSVSTQTMARPTQGW